MYKIGKYKNGQQIADEVFSSKRLSEIEREFKRMFDATCNDCWQANIEQGHPEDTIEGTTFDEAWNMKHFSEDTNNVAVFKCKSEVDLCLTNYTYTGTKSNKLK